VNIRRSDLRAAAGDGAAKPAMALPPAVGKDVSVVRQLMSNQATGLGELHVGVRDSLDRRRTTTEPVRYRDDRRVRVLVNVTDEYLTIAPAGPGLLADRLRAAHRDLIAS
jgi:hypothetical protein